MAQHPQSPSESPLLHRRVVVKAGTNVLTSKSPRLDPEVMGSIVSQIVELRRLGGQAVLVTSGAVAAGREAVVEPAQSKGVPQSQMLAAVGQSRLMHAYQELFSHDAVIVAQALLSRRDVEDRVGYLNLRNTLESLLDHGVVPIVNENDVVDTAELDEARFGDNDTLSALVANLVDADLLLMLTDVGGLYRADPTRDPNAELIERVERITPEIEALAEPPKREAISRGGMASKLRAARRATAAGVTVVIGPGHEDGVVLRAARGEPAGTLFPSQATAMESRKRWLLSGMAESGGVLTVDDGAVRAVCVQDKSLLPAGIRSVRGAFSRGDVVAVESPEGSRVAYGIANYGAEDLIRIAGERSDRILGILGHDLGDEAIHRNNMVVL